MLVLSLLMKLLSGGVRWRGVLCNQRSSAVAQGGWSMSAVVVAVSSPAWSEEVRAPELALASQDFSLMSKWLPESLMWLRYEFAYHEVWQWVALLVGVGFVMVVRIILKYSYALIENLSTMTDSQWDNKLIALVKSQAIAMVSLGCGYLYILAVGYTETMTQIIGYGVKILIAVHIFRLLYRVLDIIPELATTEHYAVFAAVDPAVTQLIVKIGKAVVALMLPLVVLQNLGVNVASLLAGLGLAGLAFSLAAKETVANFFGSLMILLDKPFDLGDWVIIGDYEGSVVEIGIRSTVIRTFYDSMITLPNSVVMSGLVDNMGKRNHRRIKTTLDIGYGTTPAQMRQFMSSIKSLLANHPHTVKTLDQHVVLSAFQASSLGVMLYFFIDVKDWTEELLVREAIFMSIIDLADEQHIKFAFPTRTVHLHGSSPSLGSKNETV